MNNDFGTIIGICNAKDIMTVIISVHLSLQNFVPRFQLQDDTQWKRTECILEW